MTTTIISYESFNLQFVLYSIFLFCSIAYYQKSRARTITKFRQNKRPPVVEGSLPLIGHAYAMYKDQVGFLRAAYQKHGPVFQVNLIRLKTIYVCEAAYLKEFYDSTEDQLSLSAVVRDMKLPLIFFSSLGVNFGMITKLIRKAITASFPKYNKIMKEGAEEAMRRLEKSQDLNLEVCHYSVTTPPSCIFGISPSEKLFNEFIQLRVLLELMVFSSHVLPSWTDPIISLLGKSYFKYRNMGHELVEEIERYEKDPTYDSSLFLRLAIDEEIGEGIRMAPDEIKTIFVLFSLKNSENANKFLRNVVVDLAENQEWWIKLREECSKYISGSRIVDTKGVLQSKLLHACLMESSRLSASIVLSRRKTNPSSFLGDFSVGHATDVVSCSLFHMIESGNHKNSTTFNPSRYIEGKELYTPKYHTIWGAGVHQCPGRVLVLNTAKMFISLLVVNYDVQLNPDVSTKRGYFTTNSFANRTLDAKLVKINNNN